MLLAIYGLRRGEVSRLRLEDFDWEHEVFRVVSSKTGRVRTYPLTRSVGDAILRYLQEVRPRSSHRELFLSLNAPFRPVRSVAVGMVGDRLRSLHVSLPITGLMPYVMPVPRDCWPPACLSRRSVTNWGTRTPTAREFMPRSISSASVRWRISTWEVSYEPPTPDRTVHFLSTVAWIIIHHGCERLLRAFGRARGPRASVASVRVRHVDAFLGKARPVTRTWFTKLSCLRCFFRYAVSRGHITTAPLPTVMPKRPPAFVPYIYTREELRRLLQVVESHPRSTALEPATIRTMILVYYGAGLRLREAINLTRADVDLSGSILTIRNTKFGKTRLVPVGPQLSRALVQYDRTRPKGRPAEAPFFTTVAGGRVSRYDAQDELPNPVRSRRDPSNRHTRATADS